MLGAFQSPEIPGKIHGSAWWFNDHKADDRAPDQFHNLGVLGNFIGMLTDSRSLLSYARHEYFGGCSRPAGPLGGEREPRDMETLGGLVGISAATTRSGISTCNFLKRRRAA
ncbi:MAG: glucuronate isomerase [Flavonifractor plautii]